MLLSDPSSQSLVTLGLVSDSNPIIEMEVEQILRAIKIPTLLELKLEDLRLESIPAWIL
ncbi:hypothetical protein FRB95_001655 [Tulasnella sp. JGI-2019a]|nr:hypothetical protein FRB95_001655 [Tulasnella sp. JGI-2019a]